MTVLVLCVDRDNDFGEKAGIRSPIVGRQPNIDAAVKLSLADPEDSDANSVFGAVQVYDELIADGEDAQVVTLTGEKRVGPISDRKITRELEEVLKTLKPTRCIFITDGAEDEFILPLVTSRIRVEAVRRIIVKQNADLESTYYVIKKALEDDKLQRTILMPIALALLVYGIFAVIGRTEFGLGAISLTVGLYFLVKVLHVGEGARRIVLDVYAGLTSGKVSLFTSLLAILVLLAGVFVAGRAVFYAYQPQGGIAPSPAELAILGAGDLVWWVIVAALIGAAGKVVDAYVREGVILWSYWTLPFSLLAAGLLITAGLRVAGNIVRGRVQLLGVDEFLLVIGGFVLAFTGAMTNAYVRQRSEEDRDREAALAASVPRAEEAHPPGG